MKMITNAGVVLELTAQELMDLIQANTERKDTASDGICEETTIGDWKKDNSRYSLSRRRTIKCEDMNTTYLCRAIASDLRGAGLGKHIHADEVLEALTHDSELRGQLIELIFRIEKGG